MQTTSGLDRNAPSIAGVCTMRNLLRGTREYWDDEFNGALDASGDVTLAGLPIQLKAGAIKSELNARAFTANLIRVPVARLFKTLDELGRSAREEPFRNGRAVEPWRCRTCRS